jgi:MFS family permease
MLGRLLRAFGFGFAAVLIGLHLERRGLPPALIGLVITVGLAAASLNGLLLALFSNQIGRRRALAVTGLLMAAGGLDLALARPAWLLVLAGTTGMLGTAGSDYGPFSAIEQAVLAESVEGRARNRAFGRYSLGGGLAAAVGGLAAAAGSDVTRSTGFFLGFAFIGLLTALLALSLSPAVEAAEAGSSMPAIRPLLPLTALFAVDALGGGFVATAVIAYWLHVRFGAGAFLLGPVFASIALLQAGSYEVAGRLADRIGLVRTMVFTHLPSNVLLIAIAFSPSLGSAVALLLARFAISQMDVPARQAYVASIVPPGQRAGALAITGVVRGAGQAAGPILSGLAIQAAAFGFPFFAAGGLKIVYDLALFAGYRGRPAEHERLPRARP